MAKDMTQDKSSLGKSSQSLKKLRDTSELAVQTTKSPKGSEMLLTKTGLTDNTKQHYAQVDDREVASSGSLLEISRRVLEQSRHITNKAE